MNNSLKLSLLASATIAASLLPSSATPELYQQKCFACHQANGAGLPGVFPPLAESEWVNGPVENLIRIQLRGLSGPITVKGKKYASVMPPQATMTDEEIATILTYVRSNFSNKADAVTAEMVKKYRDEVGKPMLTVADLIDPAKAEKKEEPKKEE
jgi:mono/diheme cytochrome c family protein